MSASELRKDDGIKSLNVFYDAECGLCRRCREWFSKQPTLVDLRFVPLQSAEIATMYPQIKGLDLRAQMVALTDSGNIYQGSSAWIMCLYALRDYRDWSYRLAHPAMLPMARKVCEMVSANRLGISRWFLSTKPDELREKLAKEKDSACGEDGSCHV